MIKITTVLFVLSLLLVRTAALAQEVINSPVDSTKKIVYTPGLQELDAKNGFRDAKLDTPFTAFTGLVRAVAPDQGRSFYRRPTDSKKIGPYALSTITYIFARGKLLSVMLQVKGDANCNGVFETLRKLYGPSRDEQLHDYDAGAATQTWVGHRVRLLFDENIETLQANIYFFDISMLQQDAAKKQQEAAKKEQAKQRAVDDL